MSGHKGEQLAYALVYLAPSLLIFIAFVFYPMFETFHLSLYLTNQSPRRPSGLERAAKLRRAAANGAFDIGIAPLPRRNNVKDSGPVIGGGSL